MTRLRDTIGVLERRLDSGKLSFLERRMLLRQMLEAAAAEAREAGYHEGMRDAQDAHRAAEREMLDGITAHNAAGGRAAMTDYRILITGSRDWDGMQLPLQLGIAIGERPPGTEPVIVHGACPSGADAMADRIARDFGWRTERHPADWMGYGKRAGFIRNAQMVSLGADLALVFLQQGATNRGTMHCAGLAKKAGIPVREVWSDRTDARLL